MAKAKKKFVILDGHAILHRAWHAIPPLKTKDGLVVNVVYGYLTILFRILKDLQPDYLATAFDLGGPTLRHDSYEAYKATRVKQEDGFYEQIPLLLEALEKMEMPIYTKAGYEADDVIGTIAYKIKAEYPDIEVMIVSGDNDLLQLVQERISLYMPKTGVGNFKTFHPDDVKEKFGGLGPLQIIDYKALKGDTSDNIPGVPGVGDKTATNLLLEFHDIDNLYKNLEENPEKFKEKPELKFTDRIINLLKDNKEQAYMSYQLATIVTDLDLPDFKINDTVASPFDMKVVNEICQRYEFYTLPDKVPKFMQGNGQKADESNEYYLINDEENLDKLISKLEEKTIFSFDTETTGLDIMHAEIVGVSFSYKSHKAFFVNLNHQKREAWLAKLKPLFANEKIAKIAHNLKFDWKVLQKYGVEIKGAQYDTMIASYLINPDRGHHDLDHLAFSELNLQTTSFKELTGVKGKQMDITELMNGVELKALSDYACQDADIAWQLWEKMEKELEEKNLIKLFKEVEMPLVPILAQMELHGIKIDQKYFKELQEKFSGDMEKIDLEIYRMAGEKFNINSTKQLKEILFDTLNIDDSGLKKGKSGLSTAAGELENIKDRHPIIPLILQHRHLSKLLSTYVEALPLLVKEDGRIHSSFNQTITRTGRLSSSNPNLQNIPIKDEEGRLIRKGFMADEGKVLISADYSQIELRIIASLANDPEMIKTFRSNGDIHTSTAAKINDIPESAVSKEIRNKAKAVNFGVIYGLSSFGLANQINISRAEAQDFIDKYFLLYKDIKKYFEKIIAFAQEHDYVETLFKRRRYIPDIKSSIQAVRRSGERIAINAPVQGTAADLIKMAMVQINEEILSKDPDTKMLLQVHDELIFSTKKEKAEDVMAKIKKIMENVHEFAVPIVVHVESNERWGEMH